MARKSKARIARDRAKLTKHYREQRPGVTIQIDEDRTFRELSKLRPGLTYPELTKWIQTMSARERDAILKSIANKVVQERNRG